MRFKATLNNPVGLHKLGQTMEKLGATCIASFSPNLLRFITYHEHIVGIQAWTKMQPTSMFSEYRLESMHDNEVNFTFFLNDLLLITKDLADSTRIEVSLKRRNQQSYLYFKWSSENFKGSVVNELKELPIALVTQSRVALIKEPVTIRRPDTYILLPPLTSLKPTAERFKSLGKFIVLSANMNGVFKMEIESSYALCSAQYENLTNPRLAGHSIENRNVDEFSSVRIKSEDFVSFLNCYYLEPDDVICTIADETQLTFLVYLTIDTYQNEDAPIRSIHPTQCKLTCHLPIYLE
ncbi:checkpoint protein Hus1/Mec3 [Cokeromyces recurvatus]|uniref:checkpoint protein Hus1/Mec3 n=1 Tax=Cokeromyces recurvatus TaxID=90255 RepID=UPI00221FB069|nr:checkpoint protein Hus1/Mec3 [Cokeromyces recurvatus]KAI7905875.1 checkpoint protein Hus1/Mec3 [Cokeromyces recurvatus]